MKKHKTLKDSVEHTIERMLCNAQLPDSLLKYIGYTRADIIALQKQKKRDGKKVKNKYQLTFRT